MKIIRNIITTEQTLDMLHLQSARIIGAISTLIDLNKMTNNESDDESERDTYIPQDDEYHLNKLIDEALFLNERCNAIINIEVKSVIETDLSPTTKLISKIISDHKIENDYLFGVAVIIPIDQYNLIIHSNETTTLRC